MSGLIGAIDVGGTKIAVAVAGADGTLLATDRFATLPERGPEAVIGETISRLLDLARQVDEPLTRVGMGCVGPFDLATGTMINAPNFPGWRNVPIQGMLEAALGVPVYVDNDANAAGLAEYTSGAGRGARIMVYATISTGIGGAIVIDGQLLHGLGGGAGEFGHQTIKPDGPLCGCGNRGCLEILASGSAITQRALRTLEDGRGRRISELVEAQGVPLHAGHVAQAAADGDPDAQLIWNEAVGALAIGLGNVVTTLAPDRLVLGGGVSRAGDLLLGPLKDAMARHVRMVPISKLDLRLAERVQDGGLVGAVAIARRTP